jgi:hypothetical protein
MPKSLSIAGCARFERDHLHIGLLSGVGKPPQLGGHYLLPAHLPVQRRLVQDSVVSQRCALALRKEVLPGEPGLDALLDFLWAERRYLGPQQLGRGEQELLHDFLGGLPMIRPKRAQQYAQLATADGRATSACDFGLISPAEGSLSRLYFYRNG